MQTPPIGVLKFSAPGMLNGNILIPLNVWDWRNFTETKQRAQQFVDQVVSKVPYVLSAELQDADSGGVYYSYGLGQTGARYLIVTGTYGDPSNPAIFGEIVGDLIDRQSKPQPFVDGSGGPNLKVKNLGGFAQFYWGE
jgi:hypothetical protein